MKITIYRENIYIKAVLYVRIFNNSFSFFGHYLHALEDFNEITYHNLDIILRHCERNLEKKLND